ncbi:hypothetical protein MTBSS4_350034 [Magnetospirillum sp. SS-4]|nr:hypothetical protein MTBSS4_350034 [Magnetospirillum sp. SS-4]
MGASAKVSHILDSFPAQHGSPSY